MGRPARQSREEEQRRMQTKFKVRGRAVREVTAGPLLSAVAEGSADGEREGQPGSGLGSGVSGGR